MTHTQNTNEGTLILLWRSALHPGETTSRHAFYDKEDTRLQREHKIHSDKAKPGDLFEQDGRIENTTEACYFHMEPSLYILFEGQQWVAHVPVPRENVNVISSCYKSKTKDGEHQGRCCAQT